MSSLITFWLIILTILIYLQYWPINYHFFFLIITLEYRYTLLTYHNLPSNDITFFHILCKFLQHYASISPLLSLFYHHIILLFAPTYVAKPTIVRLFKKLKSNTNFMFTYIFIISGAFFVYLCKFLS